MFSCEIKRKSYTKKVISRIESKLPNAMEKLMQYAKEVALRNKRGDKDSNLILFEIFVENKEVKGRLYTNFDYAMFLEYGTGTKAEMPHIGHTKTFMESGYRYWFLPKEVADSKGKEFSPQRLININGKLFYMMFATQPYPFMRPTAFDLDNNAAKIFADALREELRK